MGIDIPDSVFPRDGEGRLVCPKCRKTLEACDCPALEEKKPKGLSFKPAIRLEKSGRQGKAVTVIFNLPRDEAFLKDLSKKLKVKTGSGGTWYQGETGGVVEVQGDHRQAVEKEMHKVSEK